MNDIITILYGVKELKPIEYELYKNEKGEGILECEFSKLTGDYDELLKYAVMFGIKFKIKKEK